MPTKKPRLNLTLDKKDLSILTFMAKQKKLPVANVAKELLLEAMELQEDMYFSKLAEKIEKKTKKWISHEKAWNL